MTPVSETAIRGAIRDVAELIRGSKRIVALTGAGISTESGIPDFRGPQGVWTKDPEAEKLSTLQHYMSSTEARRRAWQTRLRHEAWEAQPNAGHRELVELERAGRLHALLTQMVEIHGTLHDVVCMSCAARGPMSATLERVRAGEEDPPCLQCGGILKSATISFGQSLVAADLARAEAAGRACDLLLAIGSSLGVFPIAGVVPLAKHAGARIVIINGTPTDMDGLADYVLHGKIGEILPRVVTDALGGT